MDFKYLVIAGAVAGFLSLTLFGILYAVGNPFPWLWQRRRAVLTVAGVVVVGVLIFIYLPLLLLLPSMLSDSLPVPPSLNLSESWAWSSEVTLLNILITLAVIIMIVLAIISIWSPRSRKWATWGMVAAIAATSVLLAIMFLLPLASEWQKDMRVPAWPTSPVASEWLAALALVALVVLLVWAANNPRYRYVVTRTLAIVLVLVLGWMFLWPIIKPHLPCSQNDAVCQEEQAQREAKESARLAQIEYDREMARRKAVRDAGRMVSPACPGGKQTADLRPGQMREIGSGNCAIHSRTVRGCVIFLDRWGQETKPICSQGGKVDVWVTHVKNAGPVPASVDYAFCRGDGSTTLTFDCEQQQQTAGRP